MPVMLVTLAFDLLERRSAARDGPYRISNVTVCLSSDAPEVYA